MIKRQMLALAIPAVLLSGAVIAQLDRQHDAHSHGTATGNLSLDQGDLRLELEIPGINLVGFEHAPNNDEQTAALDSTERFLRSADWLAADSRGGCEIASISAHSHGFGEDDANQADSHEHDHDQGHDHHHDGGTEHAEFHLVVTMECATPDRLGWIDLRLFENFPGNEEMVINVLTDAVATQARLTAGNERIGLD